MSSPPRSTKASPGALRAMLELETYLHECGLDPQLLSLAKLRASQINGCAFCLDVRGKGLRVAAVGGQHYQLDSWRKAPFYNHRERAALAWTDALTLIAVGHVPDEVYAMAREEFSERELADLSLAVTAINAWNRLMVAFRALSRRREPSEADAPGEEASA